MTPRISTKKTEKTATPAAAPQNGFSLISNETLLAILKAMVESRWLVRRMGRAWGLKPGGEAIVTTLALRLEKHDALQVGPFKPLAAYLRGAKLERVLSTAAAHAGSSRMRSRAAVRTARRLKADGEDAVTAALTNGELDEFWLDALKIAVQEKLPLLVVRQIRAEDLKELPTDCVAGAPRLPVDAGDAVALYRVVTECARHARQGNGPSLIDCVRFSAAREADAIEKMEEYLGRKSIVPAESVQQIEAALGKAVRRARKTINE